MAETKEKLGAGAAGTHAKFLKTRKAAALLQHEARRHLCVWICKIDASCEAVRRTEAERRRQPAINI